MVLERLPAHSLVCPHHTVFQTTPTNATQQPIQGNLSLSIVSNLWRYSAIKHWNSDLYSLTGWVLIAGMIDSPQSRNIEMELLIWISRFAVLYPNLMCISWLSCLKLGFRKSAYKTVAMHFQSFAISSVFCLRSLCRCIPCVRSRCVVNQKEMLTILWL